MTRIPLLESSDDLGAEQRQAFDRIVGSRGKMLRPFAVLLHRPEIATATADLGAVLRFSGELPDRERELAISATAWERSCAFEWEIHSTLAIEAGISSAAIEAIRTDTEPPEGGNDRDIIALVREMIRQGTAERETFNRLLHGLGEAGLIELLAVIGYYEMLSLIMRACDAC